jgi:NAD(P)-dependent dehydrogenase (short-subunit alcohol dehydrogenase family)
MENKMELGLIGRTAVISGGSKGIGKAIAKGLAAEGVNVVLLARGKDALDQAVEEIKNENKVQVLAIPTDVTDMETVKTAAATTAETFGTVHIVINNVHNRVRRPGSQLTWSDKEWLEDIDFKTVGMLRIVQAFRPCMARDGSGRIINISGIAGTSVLGDAITHGINNSAMNHLTKYLARELAEDQITVNAIIPGIVATEWREAWAENMAKQQGKSKAEFLEEYMRRIGILAGRWESMEEVSDTVVFLASDRARQINGAQIPVDGGYSVNAR